MTPDEREPFDPVQEFFARERAEVRDLPGGDMHWQGVLRRTRAGRRSRARGYLSGVAAAAVLVAGAGLAVTTARHNAPAAPGQTLHTLPTGSETTPPRRTSSSTTTTTTTPKVVPPPTASSSASTTLPSVSSTRPVVLPVPRSFVAMSVSNAGQGRLYVLGSAQCGRSNRCPTLARSDDNGATWHTAHAFASFSIDPSSPSTGVSAPSQLSQVRFATPDIGWAFGGGIQRTHDGGRTWSDYPHTGQDVLALEVSGPNVALVTATGCSGGVCTGPPAVATVPVTATAATSATVPATTGKLSGATLGVSPSQVFLNPVWSTPPSGGAVGAAASAARVEADRLPPVARIDACHTLQSPTSLVIGTSSSSPLVFGFCGTGGAAGSSSLAVARSTDAGRTWTTVSSTALVLVDAGSTSIAAANPDNLLAASGGSPDLHGSLRVSHDGGRTWHAPSSAPPMPALGWRWVGSPGAGAFYAISQGGGAAYWKSLDFGETWTKVAL